MIVFVLIYNLFNFRVRGSHGGSRGRMGLGSGMEAGRGEEKGGGVGVEGEEWGSWVDELSKISFIYSYKVDIYTYYL